MNAGWEGWLAPAQCALLSTLNGRDIERGQATLPNLHISVFELFQCGLRVASSQRRTYIGQLLIWVQQSAAR